MVGKGPGVSDAVREIGVSCSQRSRNFTKSI